MQAASATLAGVFVKQRLGALSAAPATGGHAGLDLQFFKNRASARVMGDVAIGDAAADTNDHGRQTFGAV